MKGFSVVMYDYKWKNTGIAMSLVGLILMLAERFTGFIFFARFDARQHYLLFEWCMLFGLFLLMSCKEKNDDERTRTIRQKASQMSFVLVLSVMMAITLAHITGREKAGDIPMESLMMLIGMGVLFYLFMFNIGLHFDSMWEYSDQSVMDNFRSMPKNKLNVIVYLLFCALMMVFLFFVNVPK